MNTPKPQLLHLQVVADVICPWCFIGKRSLDAALKVLASDGIEVEVEWLPYQLNPTMPTEGMDRREFRTRRFGWEESLEMDARAVEAGKRVGAVFRYDLQSRTPSTLAAHALVRLAKAEGGPTLQDRVVGALFDAYFSSGRDIGSDTVLAEIAGREGMSPGAVHRSRTERAGIATIERELRAAGVASVPSYIVGQQLIASGSQSVEGYARLLRGAAATGIA